mgnify:CR=1 FL=1
MLVFRVGESCRFVQYQYRRILQYGTGHTYPLGFAAGQEYAFVTYPCFVALRQTLYEVMALGSFCGSYHFFFRDIRRADGNVLIQRVVEKESVLKYE